MIILINSNLRRNLMKIILTKVLITFSKFSVFIPCSGSRRGAGLACGLVGLPWFRAGLASLGLVKGVGLEIEQEGVGLDVKWAELLYGWYIIPIQLILSK